MFYAEWSKTNLMSQKDEDFTLRQRERQKKRKTKQKNKTKSWRASPLLPLMSTQSKACDKQQFQAPHAPEDLAPIRLTVLSPWQENEQNGGNDESDWGSKLHN